MYSWGESHIPPFHWQWPPLIVEHASQAMRSMRLISYGVQLDAFVEKGSVDVLLTSESIYDVGQYDDLCRFIAHALREKTGACYVAAKSYYFGVGGGTNAFTTYCRKYFDLEVESLKTFSDGSSNVRELLLVRRK